ncbi:hypothetical protein [Polaromonas sp. P5_D5]
MCLIVYGLSSLRGVWATAPAVLGLPPSNMRHDATMAESGIKPEFSVASLSIPVEAIRRRGVSNYFLKETP